MSRVTFTFSSLVLAAFVGLGFGAPVPAPGAPVPAGASKKPTLSAPVTYKDLMLILVTKEGAAAVVFNDPQELSVSYKFRYESADGKTKKEGEGKVFERYTNGKYDGGDLHIKAGPIEVEWSRGGLDRGYIYYAPEKLTVQIAHANEFEDRVTNNGNQRVEHPKLDLRRFMKD